MDLSGLDAWITREPRDCGEPPYEPTDAEQLDDLLDAQMQVGPINPVTWLQRRACDFGEGRDSRLVLRLADQLRDALEHSTR